VSGTHETDGKLRILRPRPATLKKVHGLRRERGRIAAIEPRSGDYFLGDTLIAALERARECHPAATFYFIRVGHPTAHVHHGGLRRNKP
jgi:hypothetical protein